MNRPYTGRRRMALLCAAATLLAAVPGTPAAAADPGKPGIRHAGGPNAVTDSYIVVLKDSAVPRAKAGTVARSLAGKHGGKIGHVYSAGLRGFAIRVSKREAERLAADPSVAWVEQNQRVSIRDTQIAPPWGLDRVDQRALPLDGTYSYPNQAGTVHAYVIDTGIQTTHQEFGGRAVSGFDAIDGDAADDCHGHGTHVAGTIGGPTYGVAKEVQLVAVRVLDCNGSGTIDEVLAGLDWVTANAVKPAVANMSLGANPNTAVDTAVQASIASGVTYAIAAGNDAEDACDQTPARVPEALTVAAADADDASAEFSNTGPCVDVYAPGVGIRSSWIGGPTETNTISGTSMATPHVTGVAALYLAGHPDWTPAQVHAAVVDSATPGAIRGVPADTTTRSLFSGEVIPPADDFSLHTAPSSLTVTSGESVTSTITTLVTRGAPQNIKLTAFGLPAGTTAVLEPSTIRAGESATLVVHTPPSAPAGHFPLTITAVSAGVAHSATVPLTVVGAPGCFGADATRVPIPDAGDPVFSTIAIVGCDRKASAESKVTVDIQHTWHGDLDLDLVAPDGSTYRLLDSGGGPAEDIHATFTVDLSEETAEGTWRLKVQDVSPSDVGAITTWSVQL